jgi:hypothetical protein
MADQVPRAGHRGGHGGNVASVVAQGMTGPLGSASPVSPTIDCHHRESRCQVRDQSHPLPRIGTCPVDEHYGISLAGYD